MDLHAETIRVIEYYSQILIACRTRQVRDPQSERVISYHQARILDHLNDRTPVCLTELANRMGVTLSTMSLAMARLEHLHLIHRDHDPEDGRRLRLTLTEEGVRMKRAHALLDPERVRKVLIRLSSEARGEAIRGLALLSDAVQQDKSSLQDHSKEASDIK